MILDVATSDSRWESWSLDAMAQAADAGRLVINPIIYAGVDRVPPDRGTRHRPPRAFVERRHLPWAAGFLAGKAYRHTAEGWPPANATPDLYIGAQPRSRECACSPGMPAATAATSQLSS